jgi:ubiquinone/menaquinone biosynthesis C-methylase UbiE
MPTAPICDYEGSDYRTRFWEGQGRQYEDAVERLAIGRLLPPTGELLMDLGAGYGRLVDMYDGYRRVVLFDYSRSQLAYARSQLGDGRFVYVAGDFYRLPFVAGLFDAITQVRVIHHAADVPAVFEQVRRVLRPVGVYLLEFASKRHLKAIGRYLLRRQSWSPFDHQPVEFAELNFDFHPTWIREQLKAAGFVPGRTLTVSHFRIEFLKRRVPTRWLVALDSLAQHTGRWWQLTPSVFARSRAAAEGPTASPGAFFACPNCQTPLPAPTTLGQVLDDVDELLACSGCRSRWALRDGIYDFKEPQT